MLPATIQPHLRRGRQRQGMVLERSSQVPLLNLLGTAPEHKRHVVFESGHVIPINPTNAEITAWLDRYLGPVK